MDWKALFIPDEPVIETILRGSVMYLSLFLMLRLILKRESGTVSLSDLLVTVLLADAAQNGMAGSYTSITNGLILVATIIFWNYTLEWLGHQIPVIGRLVHPPPLLLVSDGKMLYRNMRKELITEDELMSQIRQSGLEKVEEVQRAFIEGNGQISIIPKEGKGGK